MARASVPVKNKTLKVQSAVHVGGLTPGQMAEVDDSGQTRGLIEAGLWVLVLTPAEMSVVVAEPVVEEAATPSEE